MLLFNVDVNRHACQLNGHIVSDSSGPDVSGLRTGSFSAPPHVEADMPINGRVMTLPASTAEERGDGQDREVRLVRKTIC